jgi:quercetin dioxygenase-like cupin family protein
MAHAGQILENPASGERFVFLRTAADTGGELLEFDLHLAPAGQRLGKHVHPHQDERFEVLSGTMRFQQGRGTFVARRGDTVVIPAGAAHTFENAGDREAVVRVQVRPAMNMEQLFETVIGLADEGTPKLLDLALLAREYKDEIKAPLPRRMIESLAIAPLALIARLRRRRHDRPGTLLPLPAARG